MLESSSKVPSGIYMGNIVDLGMYDECLSCKGSSLGTEIRGRHCLYSITSRRTNETHPLYPKISICLPSSCGPSEVTSILNSRIQSIGKLNGYELSVDVVTCSPVSIKIFDRKFIYFL